MSSSCSMMLQNEAEAVVTFWMSDVHALLPMFPIQAPHTLHGLIRYMTRHAVPLCDAALRMGKVSRYRHGQAIVVGIAEPTSIAFVVVVLYRLTAVASLVMP